MSKERIEGIKNRIDPNKWRDGLHLNMKEEIEWLIEQAERVQGLLDQTGHNFEMLRKLDSQNKRYRETLKGVIDITINEDWSKYEATALQDSIYDFITIKNSDLLEESK